MPANIVLLPQTRFSSVRDDDFTAVTVHLKDKPVVERRVVHNYRTEIVEKTYFQERQNKTVVFQEVHDNIGQTAEKTTRNAAAVVYIVYVGNDNIFTFLDRLKREARLLANHDWSDKFASKWLIIQARDSISNPNTEMLDALSYVFQTKLNAKEELARNYFREVSELANSLGIRMVYLASLAPIDEGYLINRLIHLITAPNRLSQIAGAFLYSLLGGLTNIIVANPLTTFYSAWHNAQWTDEGALISAIRIFFSPLTFLFNAIYGFIEGAKTGWNRGFVVGLLSPYYVAKHHLCYESHSHFHNLFELFIFYQSTHLPRNFIASLAVFGFATAAVLLTLGVLGPTVVGGIGFAALAVKGATVVAGFVGVGVGTATLAACAFGGAVLAGSVIYGIGYGVYLGLKAGFTAVRNCFKNSSKDSNTASELGPLMCDPPTEVVAATLPSSFKTSATIPVVLRPAPPPSNPALHASSYHRVWSPSARAWVNRPARQTTPSTSSGENTTDSRSVDVHTASFSTPQ